MNQVGSNAEKTCCCVPPVQQSIVASVLSFPATPRSSPPQFPSCSSWKCMARWRIGCIPTHKPRNKDSCVKLRLCPYDSYILVLEAALKFAKI